MVGPPVLVVSPGHSLLHLALDLGDVLGIGSGYRGAESIVVRLNCQALFLFLLRIPFGILLCRNPRDNFGEHTAKELWVDRLALGALILPLPANAARAVVLSWLPGEPRRQRMKVGD
jgi:hypothetical protein